MDLTGEVEWALGVEAPDFTFELPGRPQRSLQEQGREAMTLLVLYTLPGSLPRLRALAAEEPAFARARARVIAAPLDAPATATEVGPVNATGSILATAFPEVATVYAMLARRDGDADVPAVRHAEYLIDRQGYLRARWIDAPAAAADRTAEILAQIEELDREPPRVRSRGRHVH